jgi:hypothetical protein
VKTIIPEGKKEKGTSIITVAMNSFLVAPLSEVYGSHPG